MSFATQSAISDIRDATICSVAPKHRVRKLYPPAIQSSASKQPDLRVYLLLEQPRASAIRISTRSLYLDSLKVIHERLYAVMDNALRIAWHVQERFSLRCFKTIVLSSTFFCFVMPGSV